MIALGIAVLLLPLLLLAVVLIGAWREGRRSPWPFGVGRVISNAFSAIGGAPLVFLAVSFVLNALPAVLLNTTTTATDLSSGGFATRAALATRAASVYAGWGLLQLLVWPLGQALVTLLALDVLAGRAVDVRRSLTRALRLWPFTVAVTLLAWIGIGIGLLVLVVPGVVLLLNWFVVLPVLAGEGATVFGSFERSAALMRGVRWRLLVLMLIVAVAWTLFVSLTGVLTVATAGGGVWAVRAIQVVAAMLSGMILPAGVAAVYHEARTAKEGSGSDDLAAVFA